MEEDKAIESNIENNEMEKIQRETMDTIDKTE